MHFSFRILRMHLKMSLRTFWVCALLSCGLFIGFARAQETEPNSEDGEEKTEATEEKKNTAYHEAGHALVAAIIPHADPLHKVTIIPRGMALGLTQQLPLDDKHTYSKHYL